jgi:predicted DNA-binding protein YlxM (UPF0122 family)
MKDWLHLYNNGLSVLEISKKFNITENEIRNYLKSQFKWYSKSAEDLSNDDIKNIVSLYNDEFSVLEISDIFNVPAPSIIKVLQASGVKRVYHSGRKFDILKASPFSKKNKEFIVGTMLGDGCIRKSGKIPRLVLVHSKKHELYFHWKISQLDKYFNLWREQVHPRKNSTLLYTETLQHAGLIDFYEMFYKNGTKIIPNNLDMYMTPYSLAIWFLDDGTLNSGTNHRIHTNCFTYSEQVELKNLLKRCFDLECKIIERKDKQYILSFDRNNTVKLSNIIEPYVIPSMKYKLRLSLERSSTTTCQTPKKDDDIV